MKKYLSMALALFAGVSTFSSCENDNIEVGKAITFNINAEGVISSFIEYDEGELTTLSSNYKVRTRLFLYNEKGELAAQDVQYLNNYSAKAQMELFVPSGSYTAIAMTDVVRITSSQVSLQYWEFNDSTRLSSARIQDAGYIGSQRKILGLDSKQIHLTGGSKGDISFAPKPAGALILCDIGNWNAYSNYTIYGWETNRMSSYASFGYNGDYTPSVDASDQYNWYLSKFGVDNSYYGSWGYYFVFPMKNAKYRFYCQDKNDKQWYFGSSEITISEIKAGDEFYFSAILADPENGYEDTFEYYDLGLTKAGKSFKKQLNTYPATEVADQKCVRLQELISVVLQ